MATRTLPGFDLDQEPDSLDGCRRCPLWENATQAVPGAGPRHAPLMIVGEQPGDQEDLQGKPFVGPAGAMLDRALEEAGVDRKKVYVTNAVKHFKWEPRGKRRMHKTPAQREIAACHYWIDIETGKVGPKVIVALGATALKSVLQSSGVKLQASMGHAIEHEGYSVVATYHPSFVLRAPDPESREQAYRAIVEALREAARLIG
jgi:DNA polymerase